MTMCHVWYRASQFCQCFCSHLFSFVFPRRIAILCVYETLGKQWIFGLVYRNHPVRPSVWLFIFLVSTTTPKWMNLCWSNFTQLQYTTGACAWRRIKHLVRNISRELIRRSLFVWDGVSFVIWLTVLVASVFCLYLRVMKEKCFLKDREKLEQNIFKQV